MKFRPLGISPAEARKVSSFLRRYLPSGEITAREVLDLARPRTSPIHRYFNWDDTDAAEKYRLMQARKLIACLVVEIDGQEIREYTSPIYIEATDSKAFVLMKKARADESLWKQ